MSPVAIALGIFAGWLYFRKKQDSPTEPVMLTNSEINSPDERDVEALARVIVSETGTRAMSTAIAVAWCCINRATGYGKAIFDLVTVSDGNGGRLWSRQMGNSPPFSSRQPATAASRSLARDVLGGVYADPTGGATHFFDPAAQDRQLAAGVPGVKRSGAQVLADWTSGGLTVTARIGSLVFLR